MIDISTTAPTFYPVVRYRDARAAIAWLGKAFGFEEHVVYPGEGNDVAHAQLRFGTGILMLGTAHGEARGGPPPADYSAPGTAGAYVYVADIDAHHARAAAAGAEIVREPADTDYGSREYSARDLEGNLWSFGTYRPYL